jgi:hypothetical protein
VPEKREGTGGRGREIAGKREIEREALIDSTTRYLNADFSSTILPQ